MPKKQNAKIVGAKPRPGKKWLPWVLLLVLIVCAVGGYLIYRHQQHIDKISAQQKAMYDQVDRQMQAVMAKVTKAAGQPYELHYRHICDYTAEEWSNGPLGCTIMYQFTYQTGSLNDGKTLTLKVLPAIRAMNDEGIFSGAGKPFSSDSTATYRFNLTNFDVSCTFDYQAQSKTLQNNSLGEAYDKPIKSTFAADYSFSCGGDVVKAFYPIVKI